MGRSKGATSMCGPSDLVRSWVLLSEKPHIIPKVPRALIRWLRGPTDASFDRVASIAAVEVRDAAVQLESLTTGA